MARIGAKGIITFAILFLGYSILGVRALKDMHIKVPEAVQVGDSVTLVCDYDLESAALYTIKWYWNEVEFYRWVPKESPPSKVFVIPHLNVDVSKSNSREVTLGDVDRETTGWFSCEVSADAPYFQTDMRMAHLLVADVPDEGPVLRHETEVNESIGVKIKANCTTPSSYPHMNITWFINDIQVQRKHGVEIYNSVETYDALPGLETLKSSLIVNASCELFKNGKMKITCLATMFKLYTKAQDAELHEDAPQLALIMVPTTPSTEGIFSIKNRGRNNHVNSLTFILMSYVHLIWSRKLNYQ